jgi:transposase
MILPPQRRGDLTERQWKRMMPLLPAQKPKTGRPSKDHRTTINGILWILRTGAPWRDLPERYGEWETVAGRFYHWRRSGIWQKILQSLQQQADALGQLDWKVHYVDGSVIRAHQHAAGAKRGSMILIVSCLKLNRCSNERLWDVPKVALVPKFIGVVMAMAYPLPSY